MNYAVEKTLIPAQTSFGYKVATFLIFGLRFLALVFLLQTVLAGNWGKVPLMTFWFSLTYATSIAGKFIPLKIPAQFEAVVVSFVFATMFLGEHLKFYDSYHWWDSFMHFGGSMIVTFAGFIGLVYASRKSFLQPFLLAIFCFFFSMAVGVGWELYEFFADSMFGWNMQPGGNEDTMWDLILNVVGAGIIGTAIYLHRSEKHGFSMQKIEDSFAAE